MSDDDDDDIREFSNHDDYAIVKMSLKNIFAFINYFYCLFVFFLVTQIKIKRYKRC